MELICFEIFEHFLEIHLTFSERQTLKITVLKTKPIKYFVNTSLSTPFQNFVFSTETGLTGQKRGLTRMQYKFSHMRAPFSNNHGGIHANKHMPKKFLKIMP